MALDGENIDRAVVSDFGAEWARFDQTGMDDAETQALFDRYFAVFPWDSLPKDAAGFDLGCGSGRWARLAARRLAAGIDPGIAPERFLIAAARIAFDRRLAPPGEIARHFYDALGRR